MVGTNSSTPSLGLVMPHVHQARLTKRFDVLSRGSVLFSVLSLSRQRILSRSFPSSVFHCVQHPDIHPDSIDVVCYGFSYYMMTGEEVVQVM